MSIRNAAVLAALAFAVAGCCSLFQGSPPETSGEQTPPPEPEAPAHPPMPEPGPAPAWEVPAATTFTLSNGVPVTFVQAGQVPLTRVRINLGTGSAADPAGAEGLAAFTADMLNEGAGERDALRISDDLKRMASSVGAGAALEYSYLDVHALEDQLDATLAIAADMVLSPAFTADDLERVRGDRLNRLLTDKDELPVVGYKVWHRIVYGDWYLGRPSAGTDASIGGITREQIVDWHARVWNADNASIVAVGRVDVAAMTELLEKHFGAWAAGDAEARPAIAGGAAETHEGVTLYWVDRPGASQSYVTVGSAAPAFDADRQTLRTVSNMVLGGKFTARLNMNLREDKGYTYGARTSLSGQSLGGAFRARASVKAATTAPSLKEFMKEISEIVGDRPITDAEHTDAVNGLVQGQPARFEGVGGIAGQFAHADAADRPDGWLAGSRARLEATTLEAAQAELASIVDPANLVIVVVGDWNHAIDMGAETVDGRDRAIVQTVGEQVTALGLGPIVMLDDNGDPVPEPAPAAEDETE